MAVIGVLQVVPAGTNVVATWMGTSVTVLPEKSALEEAAARIGEPWTLTYWPRTHQGVTLAADMKGAEIQKTFADAAGGNAPILFPMPPETEGAIDMEKRGAEVEKAAAEALQDLANVSSLAINLPRYMLIGGLFLGGLLIVGAGIYFYSKRKG